MKLETELQGIRAVLFDLDGTLVDSAPDIALSIDTMLAELQLPTRGEAQIRTWIGNGADQLVKRALTGELDGEPEPALFQRAYQRFQDLYAVNIHCDSAMYDGVEAGLEALKQWGYSMGCITNKPGRFTEPLLSSLGIAHLFEVVVSGDSLPVKKPDPLPLVHAARQLQVESEQCLMIGDSVSDVQAARAAGLPVYCVDYGYNHGQPIGDCEPDGIIGSLTELTDLLIPQDQGSQASSA